LATPIIDAHAAKLKRESIIVNTCRGKRSNQFENYILSLYYRYRNSRGNDTMDSFELYFGKIRYICKELTFFIS